MLNTIINLHCYWILNGAIAISYLMSRIILSLPVIKKTLQIQRLKFARFSLLTVTAVFLVVPYVVTAIPSSYRSSFELGPTLKNASTVILQNHIAKGEINQARTTHINFDIGIILSVMFFMWFIFFLSRYIKNIRTLRLLQKNAMYRKRINNLHILFGLNTEIPCCWSFLRSYYIAIPNGFLENNDEMKLAIRHELQHIRQGDTGWLHFITIIQMFCFWNPFTWLWKNWLSELQEFSCDESIVLRNKTSPVVYAQCLINIAANTVNKQQPKGALGMHQQTKSVLYRRINMLFNYKNGTTKKVSMLFAYLICFFTAISSAYAFNGTSKFSPLSTEDVSILIERAHLNSDFGISATPEVVSEINNIRSSDQARSYMRESLKRMTKYQPVIQEELAKNALPTELLAVPLVESGYQPLDQSKNPMLAAGIWQIMPDTAKRLGLIVNAKRDDRLNTALATKAALAYLNTTHAQFSNWKLAVIAYEYGEEQTDKLVKTVGSHNVWTLARSSIAPTNLKKFVSTFDAMVIIMHNPSLIADKG